MFDAQHEIVCAVTTVSDLGQLKSPEDRVALFREASLINQSTGGRAFSADSPESRAGNNGRAPQFPAARSMAFTALRPLGTTRGVPDTGPQ